MLAVFKFGGASVKDAEAVKNAMKIIAKHKGNRRLVCVFSAMGKTTNALENLLNESLSAQSIAQREMDVILNFHFGIIDDLFEIEKREAVKSIVSNRMKNVGDLIVQNLQKPYDYLYDQVISIGEIISTDILAVYAQSISLSSELVDVRQVIETDNHYREGRVNWEKSADKAQHFLSKINSSHPEHVFLTQGFIGQTPQGETTTLGREGSDYTAGILAYLLDAESVTIWKDVPGVLNADPKYFADAQMFNHLSYDDTIELAYYGVSVIHPKTIKPLKSKNILLFVKSFINDESKGTLIDAEQGMIFLPTFIIKQNQMLVSIGPNDFSFLSEENLATIFGLLAQYKIKVSIMQNSASGIKISIDHENRKTIPFLDELRKSFEITAEEGLQLVTVRNYNHAIVERLLTNKELLLEQKTNDTIRLVVKNK